ncbi:MAG: hypothetical protein R3C25_10095 [Hyphomonadaceae bacterium]
MEQALAPARAVVSTVTEFAAPWFAQTEMFLANPWIRTFGLALIVYATIRVIASVYSGDKQNSELGPIGIRPHSVQRLDRKTIMLPRHLMPMNMDGVVAKLRVFYVYTDARGKRSKQLVHTIEHARIGVSPVRLSKVSSTIYGQEIPDVATADVCFPPVEMEAAPSGMPATPDRALDYATLHNVIENWREDDDAYLVSLHNEQHEEVKDRRESFITAAARKVARAREGNLLQRWLNRGVARTRPNVVGSYYLKFEFSHDPWFVLTRHPDRELKMTAWLTVLTSMFALVMDAWPKEPPRSAAIEHHGSPQVDSTRARPIRVP